MLEAVGCCYAGYGGSATAVLEAVGCWYAGYGGSATAVLEAVGSSKVPRCSRHSLATIFCHYKTKPTVHCKYMYTRGSRFTVYKICTDWQRGADAFGMFNYTYKRFCF